jgi:uncharacterized phage protein (TIGR01671 family)
MREIKFRAWHVDTQQMLPNAQTGVIRTFTENGSYLVKECKYMQYTGLKDKNGKEIYEGDILEFTDKWEWYRSSYGIKMNFAGPSELKELQEKYAAEPMHRREVKFDPLEGYGLSKGDLEDYFEIIGNIYENPELLT